MMKTGDLMSVSGVAFSPLGPAHGMLGTRRATSTCSARCSNSGATRCFVPPNRTARKPSHRGWPRIGPATAVVGDLGRNAKCG